MPDVPALSADRLRSGTERVIGPGGALAQALPGFEVRDSQRAIVLGKGGQTLKWIGQAAREELEALFEHRVHLFLHVKTDERWAERRDLYGQVGLEFDV